MELKNRVASVFLSLILATGFIIPAGWAQEPAGSGEKTEDKRQDKKGEKKKGLELKPERKIEFTTDEATWLSLDVSPDGKTIVFELLGDLYTLPIEGGEAKRLTSGMAFDSQPRYSPDGKWIAFLSDREGAEGLWIMKADGTEPKQLSKDTEAEFASPSWTPDSQYVIVSRSGWALRTYELWMYHIRGGSGVQVTKAKTTPDTPTGQRHNAMGASVSPDGRYIYYARRTGGFQYNAMFPQWQIARRDRITGIEDVLTQAQGSGIRPLISPDGTKLIYGTRFEAETGLRIRDIKKGEDRWLKYPVQRDDQESRFTRDLLPGYGFMPDGKEIVASYGGKIHRVDIATGADRVIPFTAKVSQELGPRLNFPRHVEDGPVRVRLIQAPVESPDGKRLAFSALTHIYVMDIPGGTPRRLTKASTREFQPSWSPDGEWISYVTWGLEGGHIWKMRSNGQGEPQQLTHVPAFYTEAVWSPDGSRLVALRGFVHDRIQRPVDLGQVPGSDLIWVPGEGGDANLILPARGVGRPHFTYEKDRIYVYSNQGLISLRYDGTDRRTHIQVKGKGLYFAEQPVPADDARISPDGKWVLAHVMNHPYVLALPQVGGDAPTVDVSKPSVPIKRISDIGADYMQWADDGKTVTWAVGSSFFRQPFETINFEPPKKEDEEKKDEEKKDNEKKSRDKGADVKATGDGAQPGDDAKDKVVKDKKDPNVQEIQVTLEMPRKVPKGTIVLRGATAVTMRGDEVLHDADVVVTDNRITSVGRRAAVPAGAKIFNVSGKIIVPGFIDTHAHWSEIRRGILDVQNWAFLANLAYGVTSGLDVQTFTNDMFAYQDLVDMGEILGLRAYSTGPGIFSDNNFQSLDEVKGVLTKYKQYYHTRNLKSYIVGNRKQRQLMVAASKELEMMPTTEGGLDLKLDLTHVLDGFAGNEHTLPVVPLYKDVVELVAQSGIGYTPTLIVSYGGPWAENYFYENGEDAHDNPKLNRFTPHNILDSKTKRRPSWFRKDEYAFPKAAAQAIKIMRAGGHIGIGSHGQLQGLGYHWEMWALASGGAKPIEVLRAATRSGAEVIGLEQDIGSIEPGKLADLVILDKSPLDDIHNTNTIRYVMKNGELFEGDTLNQVWPERKPLAPLWWDDKPPVSTTPLDRAQGQR